MGASHGFRELIFLGPAVGQVLWENYSELEVCAQEGVSNQHLWLRKMGLEEGNRQ